MCLQLMIIWSQVRCLEGIQDIIHCGTELLGQLLVGNSYQAVVNRSRLKASYSFVVVLKKALIEMREHCRYSSWMLSFELKVNKRNNAFQSSVGISELFQDMQLLGLLFFGGRNKVPNVAVCFHSFRVIDYHSLKGHVFNSRLWGALYSSMYPRWMELDDGEKGERAIPNPGKTVPKYIWQSSMKLFEGINLVKLTISVFEKNELCRRNFLLSSFLEVQFLPYPSSFRLNQLPSCLRLVSTHMPVFIRALITSFSREPFPGLSHLGNPRS